ncbi:superoxide dismutase family protein [Streptomyces sp. JJ66]|nr:superoxide dismutase family protein [Streptomyces sp. JJ66]
MAAALALVPAAVAHHGDVASDGSSAYQFSTAADYQPVRDGHVPQAVTYAPGLVPPGARVAVRQRVSEGAMTVELRVRGVAPERTYGAHAHTRPCGPDPADAGPHYQNVVAPPGHSSDPAYVNPDNEVWLDITADGAGEGASRSEHAWTFRPGQARSVVLHTHGTQRHGDPGQAGQRLACFTVDFAPRG